MTLDVEAVRRRVAEQVKRSSAREVARLVGINHQSLTTFASGGITKPSGQNWQRLVAYVESLDAPVSQNDTDTHQLGLDTLDLSRRLADYAATLLGPEPSLRATPSTAYTTPKVPARAPDEAGRDRGRSGRR